MSTVSILITHYHGLELLRGCMASLIPAAKAGAQVVVVDNGSADNVAKVYAEFSFATPVPRLERNRQFAGGNNYGLQYCVGDYVLLLNNDVICNGRFVGQLAAYLDAHPKVGVVQGAMVLPRHGGVSDVRGSFLTASGFPYHYGYFKPDTDRYWRSYPVFSGKGACLMFRRALLPGVGGFLFGEQFECAYEEADFCHRAWLAGWEVHFVPTQPVQHLGGATAEATSDERFMLGHYLRNMGFSLLSNLSARSALRIMPLWFATMLCSTAAAAVACRFEQFQAHGDALVYLARNWRKVRARRELQRRIRRVSDRQIFAKAMRNPRPDYWAATFLGDIGAYEDGDL